MTDDNHLAVMKQPGILEIQRGIEQVQAALGRIELIQEVGKTTDQLEPWTLLILKQLHEVSSNCDAVMRRIVIDMVRAKVITQLQAAAASGYSRNSISSWLIQPDKEPEWWENGPR